MKVLVESGLVNDRREGKNIYYSIDKDAYIELSESLKSVFE